MHTHMYTSTHACTHTHTHTHTHTRMCTHTYTHTHMHTPTISHKFNKSEEQQKPIQTSTKGLAHQLHTANNKNLALILFWQKAHVTKEEQRRRKAALWHYARHGHKRSNTGRPQDIACTTSTCHSLMHWMQNKKRGLWADQSYLLSTDALNAKQKPRPVNWPVLHPLDWHTEADNWQACD